MKHKKQRYSVISQIRDNAIAIISLVVALSSLSYNSWRNELSEDNRNQRHAAFEVILKINELQQVVFYNHYEQDIEHHGNPRLGWTYVLTIKDLSMVLPESLQLEAAELVAVWSGNWQELHLNETNKDAVDAGIDELRKKIVELLSGLQ